MRALLEVWTALMDMKKMEMLFPHVDLVSFSRKIKMDHLQIQVEKYHRKGSRTVSRRTSVDWCRLVAENRTLSVADEDGI